MTRLGKTRFLVRLSEYTWLRQIKDNGELRFTPLSSYRAEELRGDSERFDEFEGASDIDQPRSVKRITITFRDPQTGAFLARADHRLKGPIKWFDRNGFSHVLSFSIYEHDLIAGDNTVDLATRDNRLGSSTLLVHDIGTFVTCVGEFMSAHGVAFECAPVEYVGSDFDGEYSAFKKPSRLKHQREYRLAIRVDSTDVVTFTVPRLGEAMEVFAALRINFTADALAI